MLKIRKQNAPGARSTTTAPVVVAKPDLRQYNKGKYTVPEDKSPPERREWLRRRRQQATVVHTRWKTDHGVVDRFGDELRVYTGACQATGCTNWFMVERIPGNVSGKWPHYCGTSCAERTRGITARRSARRQREGAGTTGARRPDYSRFVPEDVPAGERYWTARAIVRGELTASPTAYKQASAYYEECQATMSIPDSWPNGNHTFDSDNVLPFTSDNDD